ncbi:unnamed protein product, partial [Polarella glacialis]
AALAGLIGQRGPPHSDVLLRVAFEHKAWEAAASQNWATMLAERSQVHIAHLASSLLGAPPLLQGAALVACEASARVQAVGLQEPLPAMASEVAAATSAATRDRGRAA